ncbi:MAG: hypothetical protein AAF570_16190 [Bacteroidota bacterium]
MQLFDCLVEMKEYEEEKLRNKLVHRGLEAQLPTLMMRLRTMLLKSLLAFGADDSVTARLRFAMAEIDWLFRKKLIDQVPARIRKARKLARKYARYAQELRLIDRERQLLFERHPDQIQAAYERIRADEIAALDAFALQRAAADLFLRMRSLSREILRPRSVEDRARFTELVEHPTWTQARTSDDFLTRAYALHTRGLYEIAFQQAAVAVATYAELLDRWKAAPDWINEQADLFLASFNNFQISVLLSPRDTQIPTENYARFFSEQHFESPQVRLRFQHIYYGNQLVYLLNHALFEQGLPLAEQIKPWLVQNRDDLPKSTWLSIQYNLAVFYFLSGRSSAANRRVQAILNFPGGDQRRDIRDFALLFELVLHTDLAHADLVEYRLRAARRYFADPARANPLAHALLAYFPEGKSADGRAALEELQRALEEMEGQVFGRMEVELWVERKLSGRKISEIFRDRIGGG